MEKMTGNFSKTPKKFMGGAPGAAMRLVGILLMAALIMIAGGVNSLTGNELLANVPLLNELAPIELVRLRRVIFNLGTSCSWGRLSLR